MFELTPFDRRRRNNAIFNPFQELEDFQKSFFRDSSLTAFKTDIQDTGDAYVLQADLPGFQKEDINVDIDDNYLTISAQRSTENEEKDKKGNYIRRERSYGSFSRSFDISSVKADEISAEYTNGVLKLTMPKRDATVASARKVEIK